MLYRSQFKSTLIVSLVFIEYEILTMFINEDFVSIFGATPNHILLKDGRMIDVSNKLGTSNVANPNSYFVTSFYP